VPYQSLYRRYRPRRFADIRGQDHVVRALHNAARDERVGHAYLFSGPRGTGKTTSARILAKVLNCAHPVDGEPCGECPSCVAVEGGTSFDVHELDAASNNGVEAMRNLIEKAALATPGRHRVYILDEVHMLSKAAEAALLKTLEEPAEHVVFVLATTDPQKLSPTIPSRTQHFEFHLLAADVLAAHVREVAADAGISLSDEALEAVVRQAAGSARDALSALDQIAAAGGVVAEIEPLDELVEGLIESDTGRALAAVAAAIQAGRDPRTLAEHLVAHLRDAFLALMAPELVQLPDAAAARVADQGGRLGPAATVRAMEVLGETLVEFRHAPDPRLLLDVALVRLTNQAADTSLAAIVGRLERLERAANPAPPPPAGEPPRAMLGARARPAATTVAPPAPASAPIPAPGPLPSREALTMAWADHVVPLLKGGTRALFLPGRFVEGDGPTLALPSRHQLARCEPLRPEVEAALAAHFGRPVPLRLTLEGDRAAPPTPPPRDDDVVDPGELVDLPASSALPGIEQLARAFPGAQLVEEG
jgi:DNA polymerase-3 subunit gamma/tau